VTQGEVHSEGCSKGLVQEVNITIKQNKDALKSPFGVLGWGHATNETNIDSFTSDGLFGSYAVVYIVFFSNVSE
jgi:hypothetical protein